MCKACISMAVEDRNSNRDHNTTVMIVPHFRDSRGDVVAAASAAIDLVKNAHVMAILGPQKSIQADLVTDIGDRERVPVISPATRPSFSQAKAMAALVNAFGWREVVLVHENSNYGSGLLPHLTAKLQENNVVVSNLSCIPPYADDDQVLDELYSLKGMQTRVLIVHMPPDLASRFFQMAKEVGMMSEGYAWLVSDPLTSFLTSVDSVSIEAMQGVLGVKAYVPRSEEFRRFSKRFHEENPDMDRTELNVFGLWAYDSMKVLSEAIERVKGNSSLARVLRNFASEGLSGDFNITNGQLQPSAFEVVNVIGKVDNTVGFWTEKYGISKEVELDGDEPVYSTEKDNLRGILWPGQTSNVPKGWQIPASGKKLRVGVPVRKGFNEYIKVVRNQETNAVEATGFCIDVFEEVIRSLPYAVPFEYIPLETTDAWSVEYYDELVYQIYLDRYDAVVGDVTILANRTKYVDFTVPYTESGIATVVPIKGDERKSAWIFMKPLTTALWLTIGASFIFIGCVVWVLEHRVNEHFQGPPGKQVGMIFWFSFSTLVYAHREKVKSNLTRFVVIVCVFVVLVLSSSYTANLASMLTIQQLKSTDMIKKSDYVGFHTGFLTSGFSNGIP
ncbi:glutamate receptor 2.7-like [Salvia splendens]|uniref:glutamate receptor 2.7-like n=1 Tax=Salvia splendens TaxID=180675 RepID=UPI00110360F6|nr:glutamate receptor 2.7-like [Salvia splendens]